MQIPVEPLSGQNWKRAVLQWIRSVTEYFRRSRIVPDNKTIFARYTPEGIVLSASPQNTAGKVSSDYPDYEYNSYFKTVCNQEGNVEVINGNDPTAPFCGITDLNTNSEYGWNTVPRALFTPEDLGDDAVICMGAYWNREGGYKVVIFPDGKMPPEMLSAERYVNAVRIASVVRKSTGNGFSRYWVYQEYRDGAYSFGRSYLI